MAFEGYANIITDAMMRGSDALGGGIGGGIANAADAIAQGMQLKKDRELAQAEKEAERKHNFDILSQKFGQDVALTMIDPTTNQRDRSARLSLGFAPLESEAAMAQAARQRAHQEAVRAAQAELEAALAMERSLAGGGQPAAQETPITDFTRELLGIPAPAGAAPAGLSPFIARPTVMNGDAADAVSAGLGVSPHRMGR